MKKIAFTIVLNGMPFIKKQAEIIPQVFDEWHIIEGVSAPSKDTGWCKNIDKKFYSDDFLSIDGTSEFIDSIVDNKTIFIHRKGAIYDGKTEMCNEIRHRMQDCVLMQFDVDEIWSTDVLSEVLHFADNSDIADGMLFKCNYFVGEDLITVGDNCYGNNPGEWCRLWKIKNKTHWISHEPPRVHNCTNFLDKTYTASRGWIFDHYAYVMRSQLEFKENFYGYTNAVSQWESLQRHPSFPCKLKNFLSWVDNRVVVAKYYK